MKYFFSFIILIGLVYVFINGLSKDPREIPSNLLNQTIPNFKSINIPSKKSFSKEELFKKDTIKIVNFFASWCPPCRVEHAQLKILSNTKGINLYGIAKKNNHEDLFDFLNELGDPYEAIIDDPTGRVGISWGVYGLPETFVIDKSGMIRYKHTGPIMTRDVEQIKSLINEIKNE